MKAKLIKAKRERQRKAFTPRNGLLTATRDIVAIGEKGLLNPRKHRQVREVLRDNPIHIAKRILREEPYLDSGIDPQNWR